jgi:YD repeat-containing protein
MHRDTITAVLPGAAAQATDYVYGARRGVNGSRVSSNDLRTAAVYPHEGNGQALEGTSPRELFAYNALGEPIRFTDRNGTVHEYGYDMVGRRTVDAATALAAGVDGAVRRIVTEYDALGRRISEPGRLLYWSADGNVIEDRASSSVVQYVWSGIGGNHLVLRDVDSDANRSTTYDPRLPAGVDERIYAITDASGSVTAITDWAGNVLERYLYTPEGKLEIRTPDMSTVRTNSGYGWGYTYHSGRRDGEGLYYVGGKVYDYLTGDAIEPDPASYWGILNEMQPPSLSWYDRTVLFAAPVAIGVVVGVATGGLGFLAAGALGGLAGGFAGGASNAYASGASAGQVFKSGAIGGAVGAAAGALGGALAGRIVGGAANAAVRGAGQSFGAQLGREMLAGAVEGAAGGTGRGRLRRVAGGWVCRGWCRALRRGRCTGRGSGPRRRVRSS